MLGLPGDSVGKEFTCNVGDLGSIPGLGRSPGEGKGYPLQYSGLENSMDCIVHGVTKSLTRLNDFHTQKCKRQILFKEVLRWSPISFSLQYFEVIRYYLLWVLHPLPRFFFFFFFRNWKKTQFCLKGNRKKESPSIVIFCGQTWFCFPKENYLISFFNDRDNQQWWHRIIYFPFSSGSLRSQASSIL